MLKQTFILSLITLMLISACSEKNIKKETPLYQVVNPIIIDTTYEREYASTINSLQNVEIRNKVRGFVEEIYVDEGQKVTKGQILFKLNGKELEQSIHKAESVIQMANAELKAAEIEFENTKILFNKNIVSKSELDLNGTKVSMSKAKLNEAKVAKEQAVLHLEFTKIKAPFNGIINRIPNKKGSLVDEGTLLTNISNNEFVYAYFNISEIDYLDYVQSKNKSNMVSLVLANNSLYPHKGIIETTESEFDKTTGNIAFRAKFTNPDKLLKEGGTGKILVRSSYKNAILIPQKSSFEVQGNIYIYQVGSDNKVSIKKINPTMRLSNYYVVANGFTEKDRIIYEGIQSLKNGDEVKTKLIDNSSAIK